jgi:glycosyltransferase involved in cell wall biosynthesis
MLQNLMKRIACGAPYGNAGLGQHLAQVVEEARAQSDLSAYYATGVPSGDGAARKIELPHLPWIFQYTPVRFSPAWKSYLNMELFDRAVAARLEPGQTFTGFAGQSLRSFERARRLGYAKLELESANSHILNVKRQHQKALTLFDFEASWLNETQVAKSLREYAMADVIVANSEYTRQTLLAEGVPPEKIRCRHLQTHPRFVPPACRPDDGIFRIVYTGSLTIMKGVPVLLEAFARLHDPKAELTLVGGWTSRGMHHYIQTRLAQDSRIRLAPGDPLPHLQKANVYVHPSYDDGFGYSPMEALACGTPVIVTEDTGMKECVQEGINGYVVPTGSVDAILERLEHIRQKPLILELQAVQ